MPIRLLPMLPEHVLQSPAGDGRRSSTPSSSECAVSTSIPLLPNSANHLKGLVCALGSIPHIIYLTLLLYLPFVYRIRVQHIFPNGLSLTDHETASHSTHTSPLASRKASKRKDVKHLSRWCDFVDSAVNEWGIIVIVSVLLLPSIYGIFQLDGTGSHLVQCTALLSLIAALMGLVFSFLYIIWFKTMQRSDKATQWILDALHSGHTTWWNIPILLSLPAVWFSWSLILFIVCVVAVVWKTSDHATAVHGLSPLSLDVKIIVSSFLSICVLYLAPTIITFLRYRNVDETWNKGFERTSGLAHPTAEGPCLLPISQPSQPRETYVPVFPPPFQQQNDAIYSSQPSAPSILTYATAEGSRRLQSSSIIEGEVREPPLPPETHSSESVRALRDVEWVQRGFEHSSESSPAGYTTRGTSWNSYDAYSESMARSFSGSTWVNELGDEQPAQFNAIPRQGVGPGSSFSVSSRSFPLPRPLQSQSPLSSFLVFSTPRTRTISVSSSNRVAL